MNNKMDREKKRKNRDGDDDDDVDGISKNPIISVVDDELILCEILSRLPVKSLLRFKCVCQRWRSLIQKDPYFRDLHLTRSQTRLGLLIAIPVDHFKKCFLSADLFEGRAAVVHTVTDSCTHDFMLRPVNGLICFVDVENASVRIYNLSTRESTPWIKTTMKKEIEEEEEEEHGAEIFQYPTFEFGFDPATKEHKVICIFETMRIRTLPEGTLEVIGEDNACEVLTVGDNSWRRIDEFPPYEFRRVSVYVNGVIYWRKVSSYWRFPSEDGNVIVAFDVGSEKFRVIRIPDFILDQPPQTRDEFSGPSVDLLEVDGRVALLHRRSAHKVKLWIFDDHDKKEQSTTTTTTTTSTSSNNWIEETITLPFGWVGDGHLHLQFIAGTEQIIIASYSLASLVSIYSYDRKKKTFKEVEISGISPLPRPCSLVTAFVESLLPVQKQQHHTLAPPPGH